MATVDYPSTLPKPSYKGHQNNPSQDFFVTEMDYASKRRAKYFGIFKIPMTFKFTKMQVREFNRWFYGEGATQLQRGSKPFNAVWEVLAIAFNYEFAFAKGGQPIAVPLSPDLYEIKMEVELLTDIFEIIALDDITAFCPEAIDCMEDFLIFARDYVA